jgi:hypothetical protein
MKRALVAARTPALGKLPLALGVEQRRAHRDLDIRMVGSMRVFVVDMGHGNTCIWQSGALN